MTAMKLKLGAAAIALLAAGFGPSHAQAAPAIGANSVSEAAGSSVETVRYRGRGHYGYRRYGGGYGYGRGYRRYGGGYGYGHRRHRRHGFPAGLLFGSLLGLGYGPGYYGGPAYYGYGPGYYRGW
jgi:hypothetical protein